MVSNANIINGGDNIPKPMTQLSRREQKAMRRAGNEPGKPMVTVDTKGMKAGIVYIIANVFAVAIFPFWLIWVQFQEWRHRRWQRRT